MSTLSKKGIPRPKTLGIAPKHFKHLQHNAHKKLTPWDMNDQLPAYLV